MVGISQLKQPDTDYLEPLCYFVCIEQIADA